MRMGTPARPISVYCVSHWLTASISLRWSRTTLCPAAPTRRCGCRGSGSRPASEAPERASTTPADAMEVTPIFLSFRSAVFLDGAVHRHRDTENVAAVGRVENLRLHAGLLQDRDRFGGGDGGQDLAGRNVADAVRRSRKIHQLDLDALLLEPAKLGGNRDGGDPVRYHARAPAQAHFVQRECGRGRACNGNQRAKGEAST